MTWWDTSADAISTCVSILLVGYLYLLAAHRRSPRGRAWPATRTLWFLAGIVILLAVFGSPLAIYEDKPAVHVTQHMLLMMAAPPLLALGAPMTLLLRSLGPAGRRAVVGELRDSTLRHLSGRYAPYLLAADYYLSMFIYQLTPIRTYSEQHSLAHAAVHGYFLICGLSFWLPVAAVDPTRLRLAPGTRVLMVAAGIPMFAVLGAIELAKGDAATGWAYIATGVALSAGGLVLVRRIRGTHVRRGPAGGARMAVLHRD